MAETRPKGIESHYAWLVAFTSTLMITVAFGASYVVVVGLKPIASELGWPRQVPSAAYAMAFLGAGIGGVAVGFWSDRRGMGWPTLLGSFTLGLGLIVASEAKTIATFWASHLLLIGILGNGTMFSPMLTNVTRWFDRRRGIAVAIVASGQSLAGTIWPPVFRYTIEDYGWRETMFGYGVFSVICLFPLSLVMQRRPPGLINRSKESRQAVKKVIVPVLGFKPNLVLIFLCVAIVGCCVAMAMPMVHIVAHCTDLGFSAARGAELLSLLLACAFVSRIGYGWLADRISGLTTLLIGSALQLIGLSMFAFVQDLFGLYALSIFYGIGYGGIVPMYAIIVRELFPEQEAGWRIGIVFLFGTLGMAIGGYMGGLIFDMTASYIPAFLTGVGFNVANLLLISLLVFRAWGARKAPVPEVGEIKFEVEKLNNATLILERSQIIQSRYGLRDIQEEKQNIQKKVENGPLGSLKSYQTKRIFIMSEASVSAVTDSFLRLSVIVRKKAQTKKSERNETLGDITNELIGPMLRIWLNKNLVSVTEDLMKRKKKKVRDI